MDSSVRYVPYFVFSLVVNSDVSIDVSGLGEGDSGVLIVFRGGVDSPRFCVLAGVRVCWFASLLVFFS